MSISHSVANGGAGTLSLAVVALNLLLLKNWWVSQGCWQAVCSLQAACCEASSILWISTWYEPSNCAMAM